LNVPQCSVNVVESSPALCTDVQNLPLDSSWPAATQTSSCVESATLHWLKQAHPAEKASTPSHSC